MGNRTFHIRQVWSSAIVIEIEISNMGARRGRNMEKQWRNREKQGRRWRVQKRAKTRGGESGSRSTWQKLNSKSLACTLLGYFPGRMYRLWDPVGHKVHQSCDVIFNEGSCNQTHQVEGEQEGLSTPLSPHSTEQGLSTLPNPPSTLSNVSTPNDTGPSTYSQSSVRADKPRI